jgi:hypothetical protein
MACAPHVIGCHNARHVMRDKRSACIRRHQAFALANMRETLPRVDIEYSTIHQSLAGGARRPGGAPELLAWGRDRAGDGRRRHRAAPPQRRRGHLHGRVQRAQRSGGALPATTLTRMLKPRLCRGMAFPMTWGQHLPGPTHRPSGTHQRGASTFGGRQRGGGRVDCKGGDICLGAQ